MSQMSDDCQRAVGAAQSAATAALAAAEAAHSLSRSHGATDLRQSSCANSIAVVKQSLASSDSISGPSLRPDPHVALTRHASASHRAPGTSPVPRGISYKELLRASIGDAPPQASPPTDRSPAGEHLRNSGPGNHAHELPEDEIEAVHRPTLANSPHDLAVAEPAISAASSAASSSNMPHCSGTHMAEARPNEVTEPTELAAPTTRRRATSGLL